MYHFEATLEIIGINPFVFVPEDILHELTQKAGKHAGKIPICGELNGKPYIQTLVKYQGFWRLYVNTTMLKNSPRRIGESIAITVDFNTISREELPHPDLAKALNENPDQKKIFDSLPPSRRKEIIRYIGRIKSDEIRTKNIEKAINFLKGTERFIGRDKP